MKVILGLLLISFFNSSVRAQVAPGDESQRCLDRADPYPDNVRMLMSSWHYDYLLASNGVWKERDYDNNNHPLAFFATNWVQTVGGLCRWNVKACGTLHGRQDNWLFTQFINKTVPHLIDYPVHMIAKISYSITSCRERLGCYSQIGVHAFVTTGLHSYEVCTNKSNYELVGSENKVGAGLKILVVNIEIPAFTTGMYLAVEDNSSCIQISKLEVYRYQCPQKQEGLVIFPETAAPIDDEINIATVCVTHSSHALSATVKCTSEGVWKGYSHCCCDAGYHREIGEQHFCESCTKGYYRSPSDPEDFCLPCPANTELDVVAASICECTSGYFRNTEGLNDSYPVGQIYEDSSFNCTRPPSKPIDLVLKNISSTSVTVAWMTPVDDGGRNDLYYRVHYSDPQNVGDFIEAECVGNFSSENNVSVCLTDNECTITGLQPATKYIVIVSAHNGVSDQDEERSETRNSEIKFTTEIGPPTIIEEIEVFCKVIVWVPPNVKITHYHLILNYINGTELEFIVPEDQRYFSVAQFYEQWAYVKIAAVNEAGSGPYAEIVMPECTPCPIVPEDTTVVLTVMETSTVATTSVLTTQIPTPTSVFVTVPTTIVNTETLTEIITLTSTAVVTSTVVSTAVAPTPSPVIVEVPTTITETSTSTETSIATTTETTTAVTTITVESPAIVQPDPTTVVSTVVETAYVTRTETESITATATTTILAEPSPVHIPVPTTIVVTSTETDYVTATTTAIVTTTTTQVPEPTQTPVCPDIACNSCCKECNCTVPPPPPSCAPCPTQPSIFTTNCANPRRRPGDVRNVHMFKCGLLIWDAPDDPNCCRDKLTYKVRLYNGSNFFETQKADRMVISVDYTWLKLSTYDLPLGRPLKVMVKARNQNGAHSVKWIKSEPITDSYVLDCPSFN